MKYFVTGHTGFKGAWLTNLLKFQGHEVSGYALNPQDNSIFELNKTTEFLTNDFRGNILDVDFLTDSISSVQPDVLIHLAAQPLVRESYRNPRETYEVNVTGTLNVLEATKKSKSLRAAIVVTTDKVYRQTGLQMPFHEESPLGGLDPYSSSKAMADILTQSWAASFSNFPIAIARAGNVIGGGDVSPERLVPDLVDAFRLGNSASIRNPNSIRPWQHVLDCVYGYQTLADYLLNQDVEICSSWNFGPAANSLRSVEDLVNEARRIWPDSSPPVYEPSEDMYEAPYLTLDSSKSNKFLGWKDSLTFQESVQWTFDWYLQNHSSRIKDDKTQIQVKDYISRISK